jgi:purine nucleoside permease
MRSTTLLRYTIRPVLLFFATLCTCWAARPIPVKVVVVTMFERGADTGDAPGEYQFWVEREKLDRVFPFPQGFHNLRMNNNGVLGVLTGVGTSRAASSIMALGLDPRFDLTKAYWLVAGIAGIDPADGSLGCAAWAEWVVDGDLAYEIDSREIPAGWKTGFVPLGKAVPYQEPHEAREKGEEYHLNPLLQNWAFELTKNVELTDSDAMQKERSLFASANARRPPFVLKGDEISSSTFWHGQLLNRWANDWVRYHTGGAGNYVTTGMEDTGTLDSLTYLARAGRVDLNRVMVLRTASDFDQPAPGKTAAENLAANSARQYTGFVPALESAYRVGHVVVDDLVKNWPRYRDQIPGGKN